MSRYIDADAFAEKMKRQYCERCDNYHGIRCRSCSCGDWLDDLDSEPTADVRENVKGEWIHDGYDFPHGNDWIHCSRCGKGGVNVPADLTNYCPNCGADMRGEV